MRQEYKDELRAVIKPLAWCIFLISTAYVLLYPIAEYYLYLLIK